jgi:uridine monophosphate synthetase
MELGFTSEQKSLLIEFKQAELLLFGEAIQEKFGLKSPVYLDLREKLYDRVDLLWRIGGEFFHKINSLAGGDSRQVVIGVPDTATPLALTTVLYSWHHGKNNPMHYLLLRKEGKSYGSTPPSYVIGKKNCKNCEYNLIDDVVASGLSKWKAIQSLKKEGISVKRIIAFVDRQQGGSELLEQEGYPVHSVFSLLDIVSFYLEEDLISKAQHREIGEFVQSRRFDKALWARASEENP